MKLLCVELALVLVSASSLWGRTAKEQPFLYDIDRAGTALSPQFNGSGWIYPVPIATTGANEQTPSVAADSRGALWAAAWIDSARVEVYRSTDGGFYWARELSLYNQNGGALGRPRIFVDPGQDPNIVYLVCPSTWFSSRGKGKVWHMGLEIISFQTDKPGETVRRDWYTPFLYDLQDPVVSVERGNGSGNQVFVAAVGKAKLAGSFVLSVLRGSRNAGWQECLYRTGGGVWWGAPDIWSTGNTVYLVYPENPHGLQSSGANRLHILTSTDHGFNWSEISQDMPFPITEVWVAAANNTPNAMVFVSVFRSRGDHDIYAFYSKDRGQSWGGYWMSTDNGDSRMPTCATDGLDAVFYYAEYHDQENDGIGNIRFLMCSVEDIDTDTAWKVPEDIDSLAIADENLYGVAPGPGNLYLTSRTESGGSLPVIVWNTPYISDVYFTRPLSPVYFDVREEPGTRRGCLKVHYSRSQHALILTGEYPPGVPLKLYNAVGRLVLSKMPTSTGRVPLSGLSDGIYMWRLSQTGGCVIVSK